jgi:hypothetical protein
VLSDTLKYYRDADLSAAGALQFRAVFEVLLLLMLSMALPVDAMTGFLMGSGASFQALSLMYKAFAVALMLGYLSLYSLRRLTILLLLLLSLFGSMYLRILIYGDTEKALIDFVNIVKIMIPLVTVQVLFAIASANNLDWGAWVKAILVVSAVTVLTNLVAGLLGFGFATYSFEGAADVGIKGYFYAGNELSAVFVVVCGFLLTVLWSMRSKTYWAAGLGLLVFALLIGTKSSVVATLLLMFVIPLAFERRNIFRLTRRKIFIIVLVVAAMLTTYIAVWNILQTFGLADRVADVLERRGIVGFIFSGREIYLAQAVAGISESGTLTSILFGVGQSGVEQLTGKGSIEIDVFDMWLWYGVAGLFYYLLFVIWVLKWSSMSFLRAEFPYGPGVIATSTVLILQSATAGHVVVSGMLGIPWAALICLAFVSPRRAQQSRLIARSQGRT